MRAAVFTLAILLTASGCPQETPQKPPAKCAEDDPCFDCHRDGNKRCTPKDRKSIPTKPRRTVGQA